MYGVERQNSKRRFVKGRVGYVTCLSFAFFVVASGKMGLGISNLDELKSTETTFSLDNQPLHTIYNHPHLALRGVQGGV
jgi:hypothetical protein